MKTIKYIKNEESNGIEYNFKEIEKEYNKLNIPKHVYQIDFRNYFKSAYHMLLSERSTGKTTNILLLGLIFNKLYGTEIVYIRQYKDMIAPSKSMTMFNTIIEYDNGRYIEMLTDGAYNSIYYKWKQYFFCKVDEKGDRIDTSEKPFMYAMSVDESIKYKSSFNNPKADFIIFDEFIGKQYRPNEFIDFLDLVKTIGRDRLSPLIFLLANTINVNSSYFKEFEISRAVKKMKMGTYKFLKTEKGTSIYVEMAVNNNNKSIKSTVNKIFYGFKNPRMTSITGEGDTWSFDAVPHILVVDEHGEKYKKTTLNNRVYIELLNDLLQLEFRYIEGVGDVLEVHPATLTYDDSIILTENSATNTKPTQLSRLAHGTKLYQAIMKYYKYNRVYFSDNEVGALFYNYINNINRTP